MDQRSTNKETVCAIIALYHNQQSVLSRIIQRLRDSAVTHLIIVNNGGIKLEFEQDPFISVYCTGMNLGSAGGFDLGMNKAIEAGYDFVWLLDDDNLPAEEALTALLTELSLLDIHEDRSRFMLLSSRPFLFKSVFLHKKEQLYSFAPREKSYLGFHYAQFFEMLESRLFNREPEAWRILVNNSTLKLDSAYYGGLFFHKSAMAHITVNKRLFMYWDDLDFTNRFVKSGGKIYLITQSVIDDIGPANDRKSKRHFLHHPFIDLHPGFKAFYFIRNLRIYERRRSMSSSFTYRLNKVLIISLLWLIALLRAKPERLRLLIKSIKCAERSEFSKTSNE